MNNQNNKLVTSLSLVSFLVLFNVLVSNAEIRFNVKTLLNRTYGEVQAYQACDADRDGDVDIFVARRHYNHDRMAYYYYENREGILYEYLIYIEYYDLYLLELESGDLDNDGDIDLICHTYDCPFVLRNEGELFFSKENFPHEIRFRFIDVLDYDNDNDLDLILYNNNELGIIENTDSLRTITYRQLWDSGVYYLASNSYKLTDDDNDGDLDIIGYNLTLDQFRRYENLNGSYQIGEPRSIVFQPGDPACFHYCDLDNDGDNDYIATIEGASEMTLLYWFKNENEYFNEINILGAGDREISPRVLSTADLDNDGDNDIISRFTETNQFDYMENIDDQYFIANNGPYGPGPTRDFTPIDFDGDGDIDILYRYGHSYSQIYSLKLAENVTTTSAIESDQPMSYSISRVYPNPFNPTLNIRVSLPETGVLKLTVHNVLGQEVAVLSDRTLERGYHNFTFDGSKLSSGVYFVKAVVEGKMNDVQKVMLMK